MQLELSIMVSIHYSVLLPVLILVAKQLWFYCWACKYSIRNRVCLSVK